MVENDLRQKIDVPVLRDTWGERSRAGTYYILSEEEGRSNQRRKYMRGYLEEWGSNHDVNGINK